MNSSTASRPGANKPIPRRSAVTQRMPDRHPSMAIAVVSYNTRTHLQQCLATIAADDVDEVIVVDNASVDGSTLMVRECFPDVAVIANDVNPGYAAAANQAIATCRAPYLLLLNSDTRLEPGTVAALTDYLDQHPHVGVVGPRLVNPDGSLQPSCFAFPTPAQMFLQSSFVGTLMRRIPILRHRDLQTWDHSHARAVPWVLGAALALRRAAVEAVGGFDERYFMYSEEVDLCYRLQQSGWETHYAPVTTVVHYGGASTVQLRAEMGVRIYLSTQQFYDRHFGRREQTELALIMAYSMLRNIIRDALRYARARQDAGRALIREDLRIWSQVLASSLEVLRPRRPRT